MRNLRPVIASMLVAVALSFAPTSFADPPQPLRPNAAQWRSAESVLRARFTALGRTIIELTAYRERAMGTAFWARYVGGGSLVVVRGSAVFDTPGEASVSAILRADQLLTTRRWSAADLVRLLEGFAAMLPHDRDVLGATPYPFLGPRLSYHADRAELRLYMPRDVHAGATPQHWFYLTRATLTIDASYGFTWATAPVRVDDRGHEAPP